MANSFQNKDNLISYRDYGTEHGYDGFQYDGNAQRNSVSANKNGVNYAFDTSGLTNINGRLYGTKEQLDNIFSRPLAQVRNTAASQGVNVGYDQYGAPTLNGQTVSTKGMTYNNGNWYMDDGALSDLLSGVAYKEYENPYQDNLVDYLDQLANYEKFSYDANSDDSLKAAQDEAMTLMMQKAYDMGRGNTSWMDYQTQKVAQDLIPQYEQKAYERYINERNYLTDLFNMTRGLSQDSLNEFNMLETLNETRRQNDAQMDYNNRLLANQDRDYALNKENQTFNQGMDTRKQDYIEKEGERNYGLAEKETNANIEDMRVDNARESEELEHKIWYDQTALKQSIKEFEATHDLEKKKWKSQDALAWAQHKLEGMKYNSEQEQKKAERVLNAFLASGVATKETEAWLGIPAGTKTIDYLNHELNVDTLDWQKKK